MEFSASTPWLPKLLISIVLVVGHYFLRRRISRGLDNFSFKRRQDRDEWHSLLDVFCHVGLFIGFLIVWGPELRNLFLALTTFLVALVIATKELMLNVLGGLYCLFGRSFQVNDVIKVGDWEGRVLQRSIMNTRILKSGLREDEDGAVTVIPNSQFLTQALVRWKEQDSLVRGEWIFPIKDCDPKVEMDRLNQAILDCREELELEADSPSFSARFEWKQDGSLFLTVSYECKAELKSRLQEGIALNYFSLRNRKAEDGDRFPEAHHSS
jgi:small-conductance mechanosensitive channel